MSEVPTLQNLLPHRQVTGGRPKSLLSSGIGSSGHGVDKGHLQVGAVIGAKPGNNLSGIGNVSPGLHPGMLATVQAAGIKTGVGGIPAVAPALLAGAGDQSMSAAEPGSMDAMASLFTQGIGDVLQPINPKEIAGAGTPSPIAAAMMVPVTEDVLPSCKLQVSAMDLMGQAVADPTSAAVIINAMYGPSTTDEASAPAKAMQITMKQAYLFSSKLANLMGYHSLEHYELHKQAIVKANSRKHPKNSEKRLTLFIGGLRKETTDVTLRRHFETYGTITRCDIIRNPDGSSRGFGFVKYSTDDEINKAVHHKFEHILDGQWVNVKISDPNRAETGKNATKAVEMAANAAGVAPEHYMDYLANLAKVKYGYEDGGASQDHLRAKPY